MEWQPQNLIKAATKVADWFEKQATRDEAQAKSVRGGQFHTFRDACLADAKNSRAMAKHLRDALPAPPGKDG